MMEGLSDKYWTPWGKYNCRMAAYLDGQDGEDESTGDVESPVGYLRRFGRRIIQTDNCGFVNMARLSSEDVAKVLFAQFENDYDRWENS